MRRPRRQQALLRNPGARIQHAPIEVVEAVGFGADVDVARLRGAEGAFCADVGGGWAREEEAAGAVVGGGGGEGKVRV
jgi:hypothetical protein